MRAALTAYRIACVETLKGRILDLGAGDGDYHPYMHGDIVSLDLEHAGLTRLEGMRVRGHGAHLPFTDNAFDSVWACAVLEHTEVCMIPEIVRVAKPGAVCWVLTPNRNSLYDPLLRLCGYPDWWQRPDHIRLYSVRELRQYGRVYGEVWWAPGLNQLARALPVLGHTLMLRIDVTDELKQRLAEKAACVANPDYPSPESDA